MSDLRNITLLPLNSLEEHPFNPNEMSDAMQEMLAQEIEEDGFLEPIVVVPQQGVSGKYLIVRGHQRVKILRKKGETHVPAIIKNDWTDPATIMEKMISHNNIKGERNPAKFTKAVMALRQQRTLEAVEEARRLGFETPKALQEALINKQEKIKTAAEMADNSDVQKKRIFIQNINYAVQEIIDKEGDTLEHGYIIFCYKNQIHLVVQATEEIQASIESLKKMSKEDPLKASAALAAGLWEAAKNVDIDFDVDT
ncbi:MAG: ParB N-terminal domain-containing protein [Thermoplasmata archaeon]